MSGIRKMYKLVRAVASGDQRWLTGLRHAVAPSLEHLGVLRRMSPEVVIDVGANRGQFALAVRHCFPEAMIFSFEPLQGPAQAFSRVFAGDKKVRLHVAAIGKESGRETIHVSHRDDSSSLLPITASQNQLFPGTAEARTETIQVGRLGNFLVADDVVAPALLKLDVQGFELTALEGCEDLLHCFTWIYAECSFIELYQGQAFADEVIAWLRERSFALQGVYNMAYDSDGRAVQADFLFERMPGQADA